MKNPEVLIRKYGDRRLYDTGASRYVTLEDIAHMVRDGIDVRVVDARSGKDLTHVNLTQIIVDDAREREIALPLQLLTQLVRASDKATHDFLTRYLNSTLDLYKKAQDTVQTRISDTKKAVASPLEFVRNLLSGHAWPRSSPHVSEVQSYAAVSKNSNPGWRAVTNPRVELKNANELPGEFGMLRPRLTNTPMRNYAASAFGSNLGSQYHGRSSARAHTREANVSALQSSASQSRAERSEKTPLTLSFQCAIT